MKKLINDPRNYVEEAIDGLVSANPSLRRAGNTQRVIARRQPIRKGRVGLISGGGFGHLPLFCGYVGQGLLDACSVGNVFEGPNVDSCIDAINEANGGVGVVKLFGNYGGDKMNFAMASEMVELEGIDTTTVLGTDDIASASATESAKRRGVAGIIYAYKVAGACAEAGGDLKQVTEIAQRAVSRSRTIGVALGSCQVPGASQPTFTLADDEVELGMGIHGEPGIWRKPLMSADILVNEMMDRLLAETPEGGNGRVSMLINSLGATPLEELYILFRQARKRLEEAGLELIAPLVGPYVTSMEMAGASISLFHLDDELQRHYAAPANCPFWTVP